MFSNVNALSNNPAVLQTEKVISEIMKGNPNYFILSKDGRNVTNDVLSNFVIEIRNADYNAILNYIFDHGYTMYELKGTSVDNSLIKSKRAFQYVTADASYNGSFVCGYYKKYYNETRTFKYTVTGQARYLADPDGFVEWDSSYYPRTYPNLITYFDSHDKIYTNSVSITYNYDVAKINCSVYYRKVAAEPGLPDYTEFIRSITINVKAL